MRVLVATTGNAGHFGPLVPFARACVGAGHEVRVAVPAAFAPVVRKAGFVAMPVADPPEAELAAVFDALPGMSFEESNAAVMRDVFAGIDARAALPGMLAAVRDWRPDVVVRETAEFASYAAAEQLRVPHAQVAIGLAGLEAFTYPLLDEAIDRLGAVRGTGGLVDAPTLTLVPPSLEEPGALGDGRTVHRYRYEPPRADGGDGLPAWGDDDAPLVYVTFGTMAADVGLYPPLYRAVADALADAPIRVLLTVGPAADPAGLAPVPANVHVERFWPQQDVMGGAVAMVGHGGFGTTMLGLAYGVPMVVVPLFALDQHLNAGAVARVGAGLVLDGGPVAAAALAPAVQRLVDEPSFRAGAGAVAAEIAAQPDPAAAVAVLADLADL